MRAALWAAVSSKKQAADDKVSLDVQKDACKAKIADLHATLVAELIVPGHSRDYVLFEDAARDMPAYATLRKLVESKSIDLLVFYTKSRLGRTVALCEAVIGLCQVNGVACYDLQAPPSSLDARKQRRSNGDVLISAVTSAQSQNDNSNRIIAQENGMIGRVQAGNMPNNIPFGWRRVYDDRGRYQLVINESAADGIRQVFEFYLAGKGIVGIMDAMNALDTGRQWYHSTIQRIIGAAWVYAGYTELNRRSKTGREFLRAKGKHPAIINEDTARRVEAERHSRLSARRSVNTPYIFSRLVYCERCDKRMIVECYTNRYVTVGGQERVYTQPMVRCVACGRHVGFTKIRNAFLQWFDMVRRALNGNGEALKVFITDESGNIANANSQISRLQLQLQENDRKTTRAHTAFIDGDLESVAYKAQVQRLRTERQRIEAEMGDAQTKLADAHSRQVRSDHLTELVEVGTAMLNCEDIPAANSWFRRWFRVGFANDRQLVITMQ